MSKRVRVSLYIMAALYVLAGINHFVNPGFYKKMMPGWLPAHELLIYISGAAEIILAILLLPFSTRRLAAWSIIFLLIAIFPANIQMMLNYREQDHPYYWVTVLRLPLQLLLIGWAWQFTKKERIGEKNIISS